MSGSHVSRISVNAQNVPSSVASLLGIARLLQETCMTSEIFGTLVEYLCHGFADWGFRMSLAISKLLN